MGKQRAKPAKAEARKQTPVHKAPAPSACVVLPQPLGPLGDQSIVAATSLPTAPRVPAVVARSDLPFMLVSAAQRFTSGRRDQMGRVQWVDARVNKIVFEKPGDYVLLHNCSFCFTPGSDAECQRLVGELVAAKQEKSTTVIVDSRPDLGENDFCDIARKFACSSVSQGLHASTIPSGGDTADFRPLFADTDIDKERVACSTCVEEVKFDSTPSQVQAIGLGDFEQIIFVSPDCPLLRRRFGKLSLRFGTQDFPDSP